MAVSAFKSTSKRGNLSTSSNYSARENHKDIVSKKIPPRRSRSVSAVSRTSSEIFSSSSSSKIDFLNKRDNPLFRSTISPSDENEYENLGGITKADEISTKHVELVPESRRGRSVSRSFDAQSKFSGRSLSRVDTGTRRRSVSRARYGSSEREIEPEYSSSSSLRSKKLENITTNGQKKASLRTNNSELSKGTRSLHTWSSTHPPLDGSASCVQGAKWEDGVSASTYSQAEEKTIRAVSEQMKSVHVDNPAGDSGTGGIYETVRSEVRRAVSEIQSDLENAIQRKNSTITTAANVVDIPPELVNPNAIELVSDIRREYAAKLEQSQERARKLRADLAVEEQRGLELSRILKEILPDPRTSDAQKGRPRRKTSIERRRMSNSRRLTEEAMNYFDECVSISTFDSSDFSSTEDPPFSSGAVAPPAHGNRFCTSGGSTTSIVYSSDAHPVHVKESDDQAQCPISLDFSDVTASCSSSSQSASQRHVNANQNNLAGPAAGQHTDSSSSLARQLAETDGIQDIRNYIKNFEKEFQRDAVKRQDLRSSYNSDECDWSVLAESMLFDKVILKNRIESGGLLLCSIRIS